LERLPNRNGRTRSRSPVGGRYDKPLNRESAAEVLLRRAEKKTEASNDTVQHPGAQSRRGSSRQSAGEAAAMSFLRSMSSMLGREIMRGILGAMKKG
jgi:hypothetical protein